MMEFRIADTFTDSLARLTGQEQKAVKTTAFDLQLNPSHPSMQLHKLDRAKDPNFWSIRVNRDIRLIVHRNDKSLLLCYVDHHDNAYQWAERRKLTIHPKTGAAQLIELREFVKEYAVNKYVDAKQPESPKSLLFADIPEDQLLSYGVPTEWIDTVRSADEDSILELADHLPSEASEALLELATGGTPQISQAAAEDTDPLDHPDAMRRFRVMKNIEELERALEYPWEKWSIFLHPSQRQVVEAEYSGPVRVSGSAGTGKTIVALHRAVFLARKHPDARVLLTTFSETLANALKTRLRQLIGNEPRIAERLEVHDMDSLGRRMYELNLGPPKLASRNDNHELLKEAAEKVEDHAFTRHFLVTEWEQVVDPWQLETWEAYRDVTRLGRKTRLPEKKRAILWKIFEHVRSGLARQGLVTQSGMFNQLSSRLSECKRQPFDYIIVDEAQDIGVAQLRFLAAMETGNPNSLFFAGDLGQRIFQQPFSWKALGVDIRGRSKTLRVNYRTSHQIRLQADLLLGNELSDVDGNKEDRSGTISVFNGPNPAITIFNTPEEEISGVSSWLSDLITKGIQPHEIGIIVRSENELERALAAVQKNGEKYNVLDEKVVTATNHISVSTMHLAKGLEFRAVAVMACDDEVIPSQKRIETVADDADLEEVYNTERHLLYVACTRARENLFITGVDPASEFLEDMKMNDTKKRV